jgi:cyclophilin family peptidyl-prolyl cis-trans isomerase/protein-disulfide isomerase
MSKRFFALFALLLIAALTACNGSAQSATTPAAAATSEGFSATQAAPADTPLPLITLGTPEPAGTPRPVGTPEPTPDIAKVINPQPDDWSRGPLSATVTFIEWSDFQCPYCAALEPQLEKLRQAYPDDVRIVYRQFPLVTIHDKAELAAEASEAAGAQGKFWELHDLLFAKHDDWANSTLDDFRKTLSDYAQQIGLDVKQFDSELDGGKYKDKVAASYHLAEQLGLSGTPFLLVNQSPWPQDLPYLSYTNLEGVVKLFVDLPKLQFQQAPAMTIDQTKSYTATLNTDRGDIVIKLFADTAPLAVNNFVFLSNQKWYDGLTFHRVISGFVAQAGDPTGLGYGGPGYTFANETSPNLKFDKPGLVAMANAGPDTNGSQFFITLAPADQLDGSYTIFGEVVAGMDVVNQLTVRDPQNNPDTPGSVINSVEITEQ